MLSDEARCLLYGKDGRVRLRRQAHEAILSEYILPRVQEGSGSGVTISGGKSYIHVSGGNMDTYQYIRVLETKMLPFTSRDFQANFVFENDNAPAHRAQRVMDFLEYGNVQQVD